MGEHETRGTGRGRTRRITHEPAAELRPAVTGAKSRRRAASDEALPPEVAPWEPPADPPALAAWVSANLGITITASALIEGHAAPLDYLAHVFFEGRFVREGDAWRRREVGAAETPDCIVWANRGGGKTFFGAVATLLDMVFKPGVQVRILAGSLDQGDRMFAHLREMFSREGLCELVRGKATSRRITLRNRSSVAVLAASEASVRGTRVQKVRCDEVDLFKPELWSAAQLTTRSIACAGPWGALVRGSIEALSTMHNPHGLMWNLVIGDQAGGRAGAEGGGGGSLAPNGPSRRRIFKWGVVDVLESCGEARSCRSCDLQDDCAGRAKLRGPSRAGHIAIDDAIALKSRVDLETWRSEMLCLRPRRTGAVYPAFQAEDHVVDDAAVAGRCVTGFIAGMDFGIRSETVVLLASIDTSGTLLVEREHVATGRTTMQNIEVLRSWVEAGFTRTAGAAGEPGQDRGVDFVGIDPAGVSVNDQTGESNAALLRKAGFVVRSRPMRIERGVRHVQHRLNPAAGPGGGPRRARLLVHRRCRRLIECLTRYAYPRDDQATLTPEKGAGGFDHACDALRYMVVALDAASPPAVDVY